MRGCFIVTAILALSVIAAPSHSAESFSVGVCTHLDSSNRLAKVREMGATWVRIDINWNQVQPQIGTWDFRAIDETIAATKALGLNIYATLAYTPSWAAANGKTDGTGVPHVAYWKYFVERTVRRYQKDIRHFGIWNEPNLDVFWSGSAKQYVDTVLRPGFEAVKSVDPTLFVLGPDLAHMYKSTIPMEDIWEAIQDGQCLSCFDIITHHIYAGKDFKEKLLGFRFAGITYKKGLKQILQKVGAWGRPVWLTEFGVDAARTGESEQQDLILSQLRTIRSQNWIKKAFIYELVDDPRTNWGFGIFREDGSIRPFYYGVKSFISSISPTSP